MKYIRLFVGLFLSFPKYVSAAAGRDREKVLEVPGEHVPMREDLKRF